MAKKKVINEEGKWTGKTKKTMETLSQTHGKEENVEVPTTLDQVWGDDGNWRYGTLDSEEYKSKLTMMPKVDLQTHATKIGIIPIDNRAMLTQRLVREFKKHVGTYAATVVPLETNNNKEELEDEIKKILQEGR